MFVVLRRRLIFHPCRDGIWIRQDCTCVSVSDRDEVAGIVGLCQVACNSAFGPVGVEMDGLVWVEDSESRR